jgi:hypothetical protein
MLGPDKSNKLISGGVDGKSWSKANAAIRRTFDLPLISFRRIEAFEKSDMSYSMRQRADNSVVMNSFRFKILIESSSEAREYTQTKMLSANPTTGAVLQL